MLCAASTDSDGREGEPWTTKGTLIAMSGEMDGSFRLNTDLKAAAVHSANGRSSGELWSCHRPVIKHIEMHQLTM